ncbi:MULTISPECIES: ribosome biogenesis GTPase Der [Kordiimonas]|jgi:GTP-binding protein|uniref:GTPase Der n=1 Tax=Kordiimonas lacus TaxID=637679 RepID=A0A1G6WSG6_9PROT|nr:MULTISPECIES: ribosome biogenesis GTPase Der [Kordiimonas]SDD68818.1 GTP-binding protein [Kordiimonas lacus]
MTFTIAVVGRPNVGKSTLFNRLVGKKIAIVDDTPGVTRDRREAQGSIADLEFRVFDTAGLEEGEPGSLSDRMRRQTQQALNEADIALMLYDARAGVTPMDEHFAQWLRRGDKPVILVANKCEGNAIVDGIYEAYTLGLGEPIGLSAEHGEGLAELYRAIVESLKEVGIDPYPNEDDADLAQELHDVDTGPTEGDLEYEFVDREAETEEARPLRLAIVGRPNAGKSTLINEMVGEDRLITGPEAGLTRDSIAVDWEWDGLPVKLFDTAGLRRRARVTEKLEKLSVGDTLRAVQFAEVVVLLLDAEMGIEKQDLKIAERVVNEGRGLVIALNKWDAVTDRLECQRQLTDALTRSLPQLKGVKVVKFSALTGKGIQHLMPAVAEAYEVWNARVPTSAFNQWLADTLEKHPAPSVGGRRIKIRYGAQIKTRPPTFLMFCNRPDDLPDSYKRYLENELRRDFDLPGTPIRIIMKKGANPYESRRKKRR